jgi:hypothetical protein
MRVPHVLPRQSFKGRVHWTRPAGAGSRCCRASHSPRLITTPASTRVPLCAQKDAASNLERFGEACGLVRITTGALEATADYRDTDDLSLPLAAPDGGTRPLPGDPAC